MEVEDFASHARSVGLEVREVSAGNGEVYLLLVGLEHQRTDGNVVKVDVAIAKVGGSPWVPPPALQLRPHLIAMGQLNCQPSPLGDEWQYASRRFDLVPTPKTLLAHVYTVLGEFP